MFVAILFILMILMVSLSFLEEERPLTRNLIYASMVLVLVLMAGLRPLGIDKDSLQYYGYYIGNFDELVEPTFIWISELVRFTIDDVQGVFIIYALLAIPLKCYVFTKLSDEHFLLLAVYTSNLLILHDMTQIRVGVAMAFVMLGFYCLVKGNRWHFLGLVLIATCFHVSAIATLVMVFFRNNELKVWHRIVLAFVPFLAFATILFNIDFITLIPFDFVQDKLAVYEELKDTGQIDVEKINIFNAAIMVKMLVYYFLLWKYEVVRPHCPYLTLLLKIFALSYVCLGVFNFMAVLATRISELFAFVEIMMVPLIIHAVVPKQAARTLIMLYAIGIFMLNVIYSDLLAF